MSRQWTDADVARMLGWEVIYGSPETRPAFEKDGKLIWWKDSCFGLSTPPSAEADANAARYVLPWFITTFPDTLLMIQMQKSITTTVCKNERIFVYLKPSFSEGICTSALEAYHAGRKDNGE